MVCLNIALWKHLLGFNIKTLEYKGWKLNCWDVGGQKSLRTYWRNYFERTDGVIWVVDSADIPHMQDCANELHSLLREEVLRGVSILILANKSDMRGACSPDDISQVDIIDISCATVFRCSDYPKSNLITGRSFKPVQLRVKIC